MNKVPESNGEDSLIKQHRAAIYRCVRCGSCRSVCPSFLLKREESFSARGRMALIKLVIDGRLPVSEIFADRLATCTTCLACEKVCAASVPVTEVIQAAREHAAGQSRSSFVSAIISDFLKNPFLMRSVSWFAPLVLHYKPALGLMNSKFRIQNSVKTAGRNKKGTILLFPGCAVNYFQPGIGGAAVRVLNSIGYEVTVPAGLKCCGRPLLSLGNREAAAEIAIRNARIFSRHPADAVVTACASCSLTFKKDYPKLLAPAESFPPVLDIHEFLAGRIQAGSAAVAERKITWHDPCHLGRGQGLEKSARGLISAMPGIDLVEMKNADRCCGFGGVMRVTHRAISDGIADTKVKEVIATKASAVVTGCPSCVMQIRDGLERAGSGIKVLHTVELIDQAICGAKSRAG